MNVAGRREHGSQIAELNGVNWRPTLALTQFWCSLLFIALRQSIWLHEGVTPTSFEAQLSQKSTLRLIPDG